MENIKRQYFVPCQFVKRKAWVDEASGLSFKIFNAVNLETYDLDTIFCPVEKYLSLGIPKIIKQGYQICELEFETDGDRETLIGFHALGSASIDLTS